jgi:hypothetical protein
MITQDYKPSLRKVCKQPLQSHSSPQVWLSPHTLQPSACLTFMTMTVDSAMGIEPSMDPKFCRQKTTWNPFKPAAGTRGSQSALGLGRSKRRRRTTCIMSADSSAVLSNADVQPASGELQVLQPC